MALLCYIAESSDSDSARKAPLATGDVVRPGPVHPRYLKDALHLMNTDILPSSPHQIEELSSALTGLISPSMIAAQARSISLEMKWRSCLTIFAIVFCDTCLPWRYLLLQYQNAQELRTFFLYVSP